MTTQMCNACGVEKSLDEFAKAARRGKHGRKADCKACINSLWKPDLIDGKTRKELAMRKTKERRNADWAKVLWLWNQPGYMTFSWTMISEEMFRRGIWPSIKPMFGQPNPESYMANLLIEKKGGSLKNGGPTSREYLSRILPYYIPYHPQKELGHTIAYERAIVYLVDGGKDKKWIRTLLKKIVAKKKPNEQRRGGHTVSISASELLMLWPLDDLCSICKTTKMRLDGKKNAPDNASIDRKDTGREYESGNCGWVCYRCNDRKTDMTIEEVDSIAAWIRSAK